MVVKIIWLRKSNVKKYKKYFKQKPNYKTTKPKIKKDILERNAQMKNLFAYINIGLTK